MTTVVLGGIVLCAGASRRMGRSKAFLEIEGRTFLSRALALLSAAPCEEMVIVCPMGQRESFAAVAGPAIHVVENPRPERGMLSSLAIGFEGMSESVTHAMVTLVDTPLIAAETAVRLAAESRRTPGRIVVPRHRGDSGHPVIYPRATWGGLAEWAGPDGARGYMAANASLVAHVEVEDRGILVDFDTPADLKPWLEGEGFAGRE